MEILSAADRFRISGDGTLGQGVVDHPEVLCRLNSQHGVVSAKQLREIGFAYSTIARAEERETLVPLIRGVYVLPGREPSFETKAMAVQLFCGPRSYLSGQTAGALLGLRDMRRRRIDVTRPATSWVPVPDWVRPRHAAFTRAADVVTLPSGHRGSGPFLTLFCLATDLNQYRFHRAAENAWHLGLVDPAAASAYLEWIRRSGRGGVAVFETWLEKVSTWERPAVTGLEQDVIDALTLGGLPEPVRQHPLELRNGITVHIDIAWPHVKLGIEPGHSLFHDPISDGIRFTQCNEVGWLIVPLNETWAADVSGVVTQIRNIYATRRNPSAAG